MHKLLNLNSEEKKIIFLSSLGGALEFYDFVIYIVFAPFISQIFFPKTHQFSALLSVYTIFAIGYFIRPLGGIIFSHFGDKYGRKKTFISSVIVMALSTGLIGVLPTKNDLGILSTVLLIILRLLQGFSVGGEIPGAIVYTCEQVKLNRGFACGVLFAFFNLGILIASFIHFILITFLSSEQLLSWGWRIPFILGGILGIFSFYLRKRMTESPLFLSFQNVSKQSNIPLLETIKHYWPSLIQSSLLAWLGAVIINLLFLYLPNYLTTILFYPTSQVALFNSINLITYGLLLIVMGWISDKYGRKWILMIGTVGFVVLSYFLFFKLSQHSTTHFISAMIIITFLSSCITIYPSVLVELFNTSVRYTGVAISYNLGFAIFGSMTPLVATYLIDQTGNVLAPSFYLSISAAICLVSVLILKDKHRVHLDYSFTVNRN